MGVFVDGLGSGRNVAGLRHGHGRHSLEELDKLNVVAALVGTVSERSSECKVGTGVDRESLANQ